MVVAKFNKIQKKNKRNWFYQKKNTFQYDINIVMYNFYTKMLSPFSVKYSSLFNQVFAYKIN